MEQANGKKESIMIGSRSIIIESKVLKQMGPRVYYAFIIKKRKINADNTICDEPTQSITCDFDLVADKEAFKKFYEDVIMPIIEEFTKNRVIKRCVEAGEEFVIETEDGSELSTLRGDKDIIKKIKERILPKENTSKIVNVVKPAITGLAIFAMLFISGCGCGGKPNKDNPYNGKNTNTPTAAETPEHFKTVTSLEMAKEFANQVYSKPNDEQIKEIQDMIIFIEHYNMPEGFDVYEDFFKPLTNFCSINSTDATRAYINGQPLKEKRTRISLEKLFKDKDDVAAVQFACSKQQDILDAIYNGKSKTEIKGIIYESIESLKKLLIDGETIDGIDASIISDEAKLTAEFIFSTIISKAPNYNNIQAISKQVRKEQTILTENIQCGYGARKISIDDLINGKINIYSLNI